MRHNVPHRTPLSYAGMPERSNGIASRAIGLAPTKVQILIPADMFMASPKILIGCPTYEGKSYCLKEYLDAVSKFTYENVDLVLVDNSKTDVYYKQLQEELNRRKKTTFSVIKDIFLEKAKDRIVHSRNILREKTLNEGYDYFFSVEQDIIPPADVIERLLAAKKQVISGVYFKEYALMNTKTNKPENVALPVLYQTAEDGETLSYVQPEELESEKIIQLTAAGIGCMLIHRDVLKKVTFRHNEKYPAFDDMYFCKDCEQLKIPIYADTSIRCTHLHKQTDWTKIK